MTVKNVRLSTGEQLIVDLVEETDDYIVVQDALIAAPQGESQLGFAPFAPLGDPDETQIKISKQFVMYITKLIPSLEQQYCDTFNKVTIPQKKIVV